MNEIKKCQWCLKTKLEEAYHDAEWGVPVYDDNKLFESLSLELCQSGLSWHTILNKREGYRHAFLHFDIKKVAAFDDAKIETLLLDASIVRHRAKISAIINNAQCILHIQQEYGSFSDYIWQFTDNKTLVGRWETKEQVPATTELSILISKALKKRGFKFLGPTTTYAFMQSVGLVNDHTLDCFRFNINNHLTH
jgi:DNA-3-methyladenine glycosylase I